MTTVHVFNNITNVPIYCMGRGGAKSRDVDIRAEKKGLPTEVSVEGKLVLDTTLRKSTSIRDAYLPTRRLYEETLRCPSAAYVRTK